jgi:hypothetical protein
MPRDPELSAILDQAARNLNNLELLVRTSSEDDLSAISPLRQRLEALQIAYRNETNVLTRQVLERAIDRRVTTDRRRRARCARHNLQDRYGRGVEQNQPAHGSRGDSPSGRPVNASTH